LPWRGRRARRQATVTGNRVNGRLGSSIARAADLDGDGFDEFLLGEPGFDPGGAPSTGRVRLIRGISFQLLATLEGDAGSDHFGRSLGSLEDLDRDGFEDFVVGAFFADGYARVFSSWTQTELFTVTGGFRDGFGEHLASAGDFDNDGTWDLAVVAPFYDGAAGPDNGGLFVYSGACPGLAHYCSAGVSASGCKAALTAIGTPSASASAGFVVVATGAEGGKDGLFFFGSNGRQAAPWGNGTSFQCVTPPVKRAGLLSGTGSAGGCTPTRRA
jgi:hypothetical protein